MTVEQYIIRILEMTAVVCMGVITIIALIKWQAKRSRIKDGLESLLLMEAYGKDKLWSDKEKLPGFSWRNMSSLGYFLTFPIARKKHSRNKCERYGHH